MNPRGEQKVWIEYSVGERVLLDGEVYEVVSTQRNRWGGPTCRVGTVEGGRKRWLTPRTEGQHAAVVDKRAIGDVIERFYERVRGDDLLAPVFDAKVGRPPRAHGSHVVRGVSRGAGRAGRPAARVRRAPSAGRAAGRSLGRAL